MVGLNILILVSAKRTSSAAFTSSVLNLIKRNYKEYRLVKDDCGEKTISARLW